MPENLLKLETSPYLLQHKDNPVHWRPWGPEALAEAAARDVPVLLSVGYAACHWCHVMAHESFEDEETAELMNRHFVNVKVDREERPDIDQIYMDALHALGEQGGWPLTMFLAPDGKPFWGGTYFPKSSKYGRASFKTVLSEISRIWRDERGNAQGNARALATHLAQQDLKPKAILAASRAMEAAATLSAYVDPVHGGLKGAPKFPQIPLFTFLWNAGLRGKNETILGLVELTLERMCQGGIYDHLGGGFARYAVDGQWLVPHFEKMLYDNALLVSLLTRAWLRGGGQLFRTRIDETISFLVRDMLTPEGAFASSYDADSEGEEGRYYVWSKAEIAAILGGSAPGFCAAYDVTSEGNWEGRNILNLSRSPSEDGRRFGNEKLALLERRRARVPPGFDDKILADWNGLAIAAIAEAARVFGQEDWRRAAAAAFESVMSLLWDGRRLCHACRDGRKTAVSMADDYAAIIHAALALHSLTQDARYIETSINLLRALDRDHRAEGHYLFSSAGAPGLIVRQRVTRDNATPNANGLMARNLLKLAALTGDESHRTAAGTILETLSGEAAADIFGHTTLLTAVMEAEDPVTMTGPANHGLAPLILNRLGIDATWIAGGGGPGGVILCRGQTCARPAGSKDELEEALAMLGL